MVTLKRLEKRVGEIEEWNKQFEKGTGPKQTMDNVNWLLAQARAMGERLQKAEEAITNYQQVLEQNQTVLQRFLDEQDVVMAWQGYLAKIEEEQKNAVQEQETKSMDAQEQAGDGEEVGEGDSKGDETPEES